MCRGSSQNKKKKTEIEPWVNSALRRPGDAKESLGKLLHDLG